MGLFSFITQEGRPIPVQRTKNDRFFTVYMHSPDGRTWKENQYQGYGVFGGKDIYVLIAELNIPDHTEKTEDELRDIGIDIYYRKTPTTVDEAFPVLTQKPVWTEKDQDSCDGFYEPPEADPEQGRDCPTCCGSGKMMRFDQASWPRSMKLQSCLDCQPISE